MPTREHQSKLIGGHEPYSFGDVDLGFAQRWIGRWALNCSKWTGNARLRLRSWMAERGRLGPSAGHRHTDDPTHESATISTDSVVTVLTRRISADAPEPPMEERGRWVEAFANQLNAPIDQRIRKLSQLKIHCKKSCFFCKKKRFFRINFADVRWDSRHPHLKGASLKSFHQRRSIFPMILACCIPFEPHWTGGFSLISVDFMEICVFWGIFPRLKRWTGCRTPFTNRQGWCTSWIFTMAWAVWGLFLTRTGVLFWIPMRIKNLIRTLDFGGWAPLFHVSRSFCWQLEKECTAKKKTNCTPVWLSFCLRIHTGFETDYYKFFSLP